MSLRVEGLTLKYGARVVLADMTAAFEDGCFCCVVGENGSGKSTLLRALAGIRPYEGRILLDGEELRAIARARRAQRIAYLPQARPVPAIDVRTLIAHGRYPHLGFSKTLRPEDLRAIARAAELTGVTQLLDQPVGALSGGERQRAYLAMLTAQDAQTLLLDEPMTHLDLRHQLALIDILEALRRSGRRVIMAAHDLPQAFSCATEIKLIADGRLAAQGAPAQLCKNPALERCFGVSMIRQPREDGIYRYQLVRARD